MRRNASREALLVERVRAKTARRAFPSAKLCPQSIRSQRFQIEFSYTP